MPKKVHSTRLCGLVVAVFTPFTPDGKSVNLDLIDGYVEHLYQNQVVDVFINGTSGEGMSMTIEERKKVAEKWVTAGKEKLNKIIIQVGAHNLVESQELATHAQQIGASAIASLPSLFFKPKTVDTLIEYCKQIAECAPNLPFYYYHFPPLTQVHVDMQEFFLKGEKAIPTLAGMKFQSSHLMEAVMVNHMHQGTFQVMLACDELYLGAMAMGIDWAIGTSYNFLPNVIHRMIESFNRGDIHGARAEQNRVHEVINIKEKYQADIATFKEVMRLIGLDMGPPRLPLPALSDQQRQQLNADLEKIGFFHWTKEHLTPPSSPVGHQTWRRLNRPLTRGTSLLTSDGDEPKTPGFEHRCGSSSSMHRTSSSSSEHGVMHRTGSADHEPKQHKPLAKQQSSTTLLTE